MAPLHPLILMVEDDPEIAELLRIAFSREGWRIAAAGDGEAGLALIATEAPACVVLDVMLPGIDGIEVLRRLKAGAETRRIPVIMTTARGEDVDVVTGLEIGADDYVVKPFSPRVLVARIRAALRRTAEAADRGDDDLDIKRGALSLNPARHSLRCHGTPVELSATEFAILELLMRNPGRVFTRGGIIDAVKGPDYPVTDRSVDVQILQLRKKLGPDGDSVETVRGVGYRLKEGQ